MSDPRESSKSLTHPGSVGDVVAELVRGLQPVRRVPRLRVAAAWLALLWSLAVLVAVLARGFRPDLLQVIGSSGAFMVILAGLGLIGVGGVLAALASSVPGREPAVRMGLGLGLVGVLLATGVGGLLVLWEAGSETLICPFTNDLACFGMACLVALPPALGALTFVSRGSAFRPLLAVLTCVAGAVGLGALLVHLTCAEPNPRHIILSHTLAPLLAVVVLGLPFRLALKRLAV